MNNRTRTIVIAASAVLGMSVAGGVYASTPGDSAKTSSHSAKAQDHSAKDDNDTAFGASVSKGGSSDVAPGTTNEESKSTVTLHLTKNPHPTEVVLTDTKGHNLSEPVTFTHDGKKDLATDVPAKTDFDLKVTPASSAHDYKIKGDVVSH